MGIDSLKGIIRGALLAMLCLSPTGLIANDQDAKAIAKLNHQIELTKEIRTTLERRDFARKNMTL